ncbi:MAG: hypothetical protein SynsKO_26100 [Synoicihabitans sp.]
MKSRRGFSLIEVVVAIGVFVAGVVAAVALLSQTSESAGQRLSAATANRVAASSKALIRHFTWAEATSMLTADAPVWATRDGSRIGWVDTVATNEAFYEIRLRRDVELSPGDADASAAFLAFQIEVRWPVWQTVGTRVPDENQDVVMSRVVVHR